MKNRTREKNPDNRIVRIIEVRLYQKNYVNLANNYHHKHSFHFRICIVLILTTCFGTMIYRTMVSIKRLPNIKTRVLYRSRKKYFEKHLLKKKNYFRDLVLGYWVRVLLRFVSYPNFYYKSRVILSKETTFLSLTNMFWHLVCYIQCNASDKSGGI